MTLPPIDDAAAMAVLADELSARGDPRGELIHLELALESAPGDARLVRAEEQHRAKHSRSLLGGLRGSTSLFTLTWRRGFILGAQLESTAAGLRRWHRGQWLEPEPPAPAKYSRLVRELLLLESAAPLVALAVRLPETAFSRAELVACAEEVRRRAPPRLEALSLHLMTTDLEDSDGRWQTSPFSEFELDGVACAVAAELEVQVRAALVR